MNMKQQAGVWLVLGFLILAVGIVYALSVSTPGPGSTATVPASTPGPAIASGAEAPNSSLSPDLSKVDAYQFLDPVTVGKTAPDFTAKTADGKTIRLSDFKGKKNVVLAFYQGSFCTVCGAQLTNFQKHLSDFKAQDAEIVAISADDALHAMQSVGEHGLTFKVVPDAKKEIIRKYGVANVSRKHIAWPSLFVVDKQGKVQLSYASQEGHRLHSNEVLPVLSKLTGKSAPKLGYDD
jgi:peroxiredoxin